MKTANIEDIAVLIFITFFWFTVGYCCGNYEGKKKEKAQP